MPHPRLAVLLLLALLAAGCTLPERPVLDEPAATTPSYETIHTPVDGTTAPPRPPRERAAEVDWPENASFLRYEATTVTGSGARANASYEFRYENDTWSSTCRATFDAEPRAVALAPPTGPRETRVDDRALLRTLTAACSRHEEPLRVTGRQNYSLEVNGADGTFLAWHAEEGPWSAPHDAFDVLWDPATGVVLQWEMHYGRGRVDHGRLEATDAPLTPA